MIPNTWHSGKDKSKRVKRLGEERDKKPEKRESFRTLLQQMEYEMSPPCTSGIGSDFNLFLRAESTVVSQSCVSLVSETTSGGL